MFWRGVTVCVCVTSLVAFDHRYTSAQNAPMSHTKTHSHCQQPYIWAFSQSECCITHHASLFTLKISDKFSCVKSCLCKWHRNWELRFVSRLRAKIPATQLVQMKGKIVPVQAIRAYGEVQLQLQSFFKFALDNEWPTSYNSSFTPRNGSIYVEYEPVWNPTAGS
jgi:hypothetical protein